MRRSARAAVVLALSGTLLAACGSGDGGMESAVNAPAQFADESVSVEQQIRQEQQVIRTANVTLEVDDVDESVSSITMRVDRLDGFIQNRSVNRYDDDATASLTIRIPATSLDDFLSSLAQEGDVLNSTVDAQDVSLEVIDLEARIKTLESSIDRLRVLQRQATTVADLVAVESELATRQAELESLTARRDFLANQVDLATVYLWIDQADTGAALTPDFLGGLQRGWDALLTLGAGLITGVGFLLPTALVGLVIAAAVFILVRLVRNRTNRKEQQ